MGRWIYDADGHAVTLARPVGFDRPIEARPYQEATHQVQGQTLTPASEWWEGQGQWPFHGMPGPLKCIDLPVRPARKGRA